ncbi:hypothetical protein QS257_17240 [Terrilactibacillus sp. S3-3]|nr:hypothetical protein QS257_17240 [Terrilactibacillus sp. S3-3]
MWNIKRAKEILENRIDIAENGRGMSPFDGWWEEFPNILSKNQKETEAFLEACSDKELYYISEVFEEIAFNFKTQSFIVFLKELSKKHPAADMEEDIRRAEEVL